jgi:hypothetical protein
MVVMVAEEDFTAAADSVVARQEVSVVAAEVTTEDTVVMVGTGAMDGMAATMVGTADIGATHTTVTDGIGFWLWVAVLGLGIPV